MGGGAPVTALSDDACLWVMAGAMEAGLALDASALARLAAGRDHLGPLRAARPGLLGALLRRDRAERAGPTDPGEVAPAAVARWRADPTYRPAALARVAAALDPGAAGLSREPPDLRPKDGLGSVGCEA